MTYKDIIHATRWASYIKRDEALQDAAVRIVEQVDELESFIKDGEFMREYELGYNRAVRDIIAAFEEARDL